MTEPRVAVVTPVQRSIIGELTRDGADNITIGRRLGMTPGNVATHLNRVLRRCDLDNRTELAVALLRGYLKLRVEDQTGKWARPT